jgi:hypothetical protein
MGTKRQHVCRRRRLRGEPNASHRGDDLAKVGGPGSYIRDASMELVINGRTVAQGHGPGLIPVQPQDELSIGDDSRSAVGEYSTPYPLPGVITDIHVVAQ